MNIPFLSGNKTKELEKRIKELEKVVFVNKKTLPIPKKVDRKDLPPLSLLSDANNDGLIPFKWLLELYMRSGSEDILPIILGVNEHGRAMSYDIYKMPHLLIAGTTGVGKTVFLVSVIASLLFQKTAEDLRLIIVDPKRVEMPSLLSNLPHLLTPVIVDVETALSALRWTVAEMENRYKKLARIGARNVAQYNEMNDKEKMPYIVFIIDELADLMIFSPKDIEALITRLAQMSRATGIHLILSTQRPVRDVISGLMKANIPTRIAFNVSSKHDSKIILDMAGAEELKEPGDMLFLPPDIAKPIKVHAPYITEQEFMSIINWIIERKSPIKYTEEQVPIKEIESYGKPPLTDRDPLFNKAIQIVSNFDKASASLLQRRLMVGYARAARILDELEEAGLVGPAEGSAPREVIKK